MARNSQKIASIGQKYAKMVTKKQVGQRVGHVEMPKKIFFTNLMPTFNDTSVNLRAIATKNMNTNPPKVYIEWASAPLSENAIFHLKLSVNVFPYTENGP